MSLPQELILVREDTEQVEDVKVFLSIVKVLVSLGPVYLPDYAANSSSVNYQRIFGIGLLKQLHPLIFSPGVLSLTMIILALPFYVFLLKPALE